jgi:hypothetical protein
MSSYDERWVSVKCSQLADLFFGRSSLGMFSFGTSSFALQLPGFVVDAGFLFGEMHQQ